MMPNCIGLANKKAKLPRTGFFIFLSFEDKKIDNDLLEIFVLAKLYSLVQNSSQTFLFPV